MKWAKVYPVVIIVACALVITAYVPPILTDNLVTAVAQIRQNAAKTENPYVPSQDTETPYPEATSAQKKTK